MLPVPHLRLPHKLPPPVVGPLLPGPVLALLPLLCGLLLPIGELLYPQAPAGLVVAMDSPLDVLDGIETSRVAVDLVYEGVGHPLVVGAEESEE